MNGWSKLAGVIWIVSFIGTSQAQSTGPEVKGLWILPTEFKIDGSVPKDGDPQKIAQRKFAETGKLFLKSYGNRTHNLKESVLEGPGVTREEVLTKATEILKSLKPGSIFVFYYGGHGVRPGLANRGSTYLALQGCEVGNGPTTWSKMITLDEIVALQSDFESVYFFGFVDACFSGNEAFNASQAFRSVNLGTRGFLLCSSGSDRKSYSDSFTKALTKIYDSNELFSKVTNPYNLWQQVKAVGNFFRDQNPRLIPAGSTMQVIYPLPGLCFCTVTFSRPIKAIVEVTITTPDGKSLPPFTFNERIDGEDVRPVGSVAFPIPQLDGIKIIIGLGTNFETKPMTVNAKSRNHYPLAVKGVPSALLVAANPSEEELISMGNEFQTLITRAKNFGLNDSEVTDAAKPLLATYFASTSSEIAGSTITEQAKFLVEAAPDSPDVPALKVIAGMTEPSLDASGFETLERALAIGLPPDPKLAALYAQHVRTNVQILGAAKEEDAWIKSGKITSKFATASKVVAVSKSEEALATLSESYKAAKSPENRILNQRDSYAVGKCLSIARESSYNASSDKGGGGGSSGGHKAESATSGDRSGRDSGHGSSKGGSEKALGDKGGRDKGDRR